MRLPPPRAGSRRFLRRTRRRPLRPIRRSSRRPSKCARTRTGCASRRRGGRLRVPTTIASFFSRRRLMTSNCQPSPYRSSRRRSAGEPAEGGSAVPDAGAGGTDSLADGRGVRSSGPGLDSDGGGAVGARPGRDAPAPWKSASSSRRFCSRIESNADVYRELTTRPPPGRTTSAGSRPPPVRVRSPGRAHPAKPGSRRLR